MTDDARTTLIEASDLAGLNRYVDAVCARRDWDQLIETRDLCNEAVTRGKQVWAVAQYAEYRMALEAPAEIAASVVSDGKGRFALGPLWEVAASTHTWADLKDHVSVPTVRAMTAHERSIRGDAVDETEIDSAVLGIPVEVQDWEPRYPVAEYRSDRASFPDEIFDIPMRWIDLAEPGVALPDDAVCDVLGDVVKAWWDDSLGKSEVVTVDGTIEEAIRSLGPHRVRAAEIDMGTAMEALVWAGASGGAHGNRRGTPVGRASAWWVLLEVLGYDEPPDEPGLLAQEAETLRWMLWDPGDRVGGWNLHLGVEDPEDGIAWVISAVDAV